MRTLKKLLGAALAFVMILSAAACASGSETGKTGADATTGAETQQENTDILSYLPNEDFGGGTFTIMCRSEQLYEFNIENETGDTIEDAVYKRNMEIEDRYNVDIATYDIFGDWNNLSPYLKAVSSAVMAGDSSYDVITGYAYYIVNTAVQGHMLNLKEQPHLDFSNTWWSAAIDESTVNGKVYFITGDISLTLWEYLFCIYFNKQLAADYNVGDLYKLVRDGKWTFDRMAEMCMNVSRDLDGDSKFTEADLYGYATTTGNLLDNFVSSFDINFTEQGDDGYHTLALESERTIDAYGKLHEFLQNKQNVFSTPETIYYPINEHDDMFMEDRVLLLPEYLGNAKILRGMESDFGIIPYPKYDETQKSYRSQSQNGYTLLGIPKTASDPARSAFLLEAMCAKSYEIIRPAFYDKALAGKFARDEESAEMINIIRGGLSFDFGMIYSYELDGIAIIFRNTPTVKTFASSYESKRKTYETKLKQLNEKFAEIET
jgi:ABC-type glycerol-3-phosphate transport system substrate-binding protein